MKRPFFIMMYSQDGEKMQPLIGNADDDYEDEYATGYKTRREAEQAALKHPYASALGFEVFSMEDGA
jgi:hypothetical protein